MLRTIIIIIIAERPKSPDKGALGVMGETHFRKSLEGDGKIDRKSVR